MKTILIAAVAALLAGPALAGKTNHDRVVACSWSSMIVENQNIDAETRLYAADYSEQRCGEPALLKRVEALVCESWTQEGGATAADCREWLGEFRRTRGSINKLKKGER